MTCEILATSKDAIKRWAAILRDGGLVAMPTETVYGLAADATNDRAVAKIFEAKGRPQFNPLITHVASAEQAREYVQMNETARELAAQFWPGPLTMILPRVEGCKLSDLTCAGLPSSAIRVPSSKAALDLIKAAGVPLAAPSANVSGTLSPTTPAHVVESFCGHDGGDKIDMILADGACAVGLESTVIDLTGGAPIILRPGGVTADQISDALGQEIAIHHHDEADESAPKSPGLLLKHYAPSIPVRLNAIDVGDGEALLAFGSIKFMGLKSGGGAASLPENQIRNLSESGDLHEAAANLFRMMRELDQPEHAGIAVMNIPDTGLGVAMNDRLRRASQAI
jgi:L-threonylcarbamoyladenylate synthase